jgi:hypothetical protein
LGALTQSKILIEPRENPGQTLLLFADLLKQGEAERRRGPADAHGVIPALDLHADQRLRFRDRQTAQTHRVDQLKYRGVNPNAQCQRQYRGDGETRTFAQGTQGKSKISQGGFGPRPAARIA